MSEPKRSIQERLVRLDELLAWFDGDDFDLEIALDKFAEAKKLADAITRDLAAVKNTITVVSEQFSKEKP
jgi:hypothetical protein